MNRHYNTDEAPSQREVDRALATRMPFLLDDTRGELSLPRGRAWDIRLSSTLGSGIAGTELVALAARMERILVTSDASVLDDLRIPPDATAGLVVVRSERAARMDEFLVTVVGLLGPFRALYHGVKVQEPIPGTLAITAPAGRARRVTRRFQLDRDSLPLLTDIASSDGRTLGFPGYRRARSRAAVLA